VDYEALTSDGGVVRIRTLTGDDAGPLRALNERVSDDNLYLRFFSADRRAATAYADRLTARAPGDDHVTLVAEVGDVLVALAG